MTAEQSAADPPCMFIVKPEAGCQGKGIFIARKIEELQQKIDKNFQNQQKQFDAYLKQEESYETALKYGQDRR
jgi:predicted ATP-grasp superfamily ATP-dependent carboligase